MKPSPFRPRGGRPSQGHCCIDWGSLGRGYCGRNDRDRLAQMVSSWRARAAEFGSRAHADRLVSLCQDVLGAIAGERHALLTYDPIIAPACP